MKIAINSFSLASPYRGTSLPTHARVFCSKSFTSTGGARVIGSVVKSGKFYRETTVTIDGNGILTVGAFSGENGLEPTILSGYEHRRDIFTSRSTPKMSI